MSEETKKEQEVFLRTLLNSEDPLTDDNKEKIKSFYLHNYKPLQEDKKHSEILNVKIDRNHDKNNSKCFSFKFDANSDYKIISYKHLVKTGSKANSSKEIMIRTLRNEIQYQIDDWKRENINLKTSESDEADHDPPFRVLVELFQENFGEIKQSTQEQKKKYLNPETQEAWENFHKSGLKWTKVDSYGKTPS